MQSVSGSFCMHISGIVSYDCKNESSSHQLKYFIFTDRAVLWLSLRVISDVSHSVTLLSSMKNISRFLFVFFIAGNYIQGTKLENEPHVQLHSVIF